MKKPLWGLLLLVSGLAHSTLAGAASVVLGQAGASGVSAIISPDPGEIGRAANIWMGGVLNGTLYLRNGPSTWVEYRGGPFPIALTSAALPSSLQVSIINIDVSSVPELDVYVGYGSAEADLLLSGHLAKVYTTIPTPTATAVGVASGSATSATIGAAGGSVSTADGKIALTIPAGALASNTTISIQPLTNMAHGKIGAAYRLTPDGQTFLTPVTLTFPYTDQDLLGTAAEVLGVAFQTADSYWQWAGDATVDTTAKTVSVSSSHFSAYSLVEGLQIIPASKTVKVNGSVGLEVVNCFGRYTIPGTDPPLISLVGYNCDTGEERRFVSPASEWSVNGRPGGGGVFGTVIGSASGATYTAPATEPIPNTVAVSARVERALGGRTLVVSNITITEDSWTGTASSSSTSVAIVTSGTAQVTWTLESRDNNIATYIPTGTASAIPTGALAACSFTPSDGTINPSDGWLKIDYSATPPTYYGIATTGWSATWTCPQGPNAPPIIFSLPALVQFFGGSKGIGGVQAQGLVSPDGVTIEGSDTMTFASGTTTFNWKFTHNE